MNTLIAANASCLDQGISLLDNLPEDLYARLCPELFDSSIGGHFRHNIDHYLAFQRGYAEGRIDYDARDRNGVFESDPAVAAAAMAALRVWFLGIAGHDLEKDLYIKMDDGGDSAWSRTTLGRELQFLLSHTIHHYALVVSIGSRFGLADYPDGFGVAPSTLHHCAQQEA